MFLQQRENLSAKVGGSLIVTEVYSSVSFSCEILSSCRSQSRLEEKSSSVAVTKKKRVAVICCLCSSNVCEYSKSNCFVAVRGRFK